MENMINPSEEVFILYPMDYEEFLWRFYGVSMGSWRQKIGLDLIANENNDHHQN